MRMLKESVTDRSVRLQMEERMQSNSDMITILIDNIILVIKLNVLGRGGNYCKTVFGRIVRFISCDYVYILTEIQNFYCENEHYLQKMAIFISDGISVMLGKYNGMAAILKREIHHLCGLFCVSNLKDLAVEDT
ncbi:hypothetical protein RF11_06663 [Thelohanellus kitauei]|uniref:Uncharacterized protein n=1 Tax=Thelohanellus kitauei TaxID=669202 RepID=A0A0C2MH41_THEKT|nr:hypothetical protein RF11_06663 [Thelohanellus kitauei]